MLILCNPRNEHCYPDVRNLVLVTKIRWEFFNLFLMGSQFPQINFKSIQLSLSGNTESSTVLCGEKKKSGGRSNDFFPGIDC